MIKQQDAPMLIIMGQSNAHGHGTRLPEEERIVQPLRHVYGLGRAENQAYGLTDVSFRGFTTAGMNLGETQDHTYCLGEGFARLWEAAAEINHSLAPLYIVQISIGGQGVAAYEKEGQNMWYPNRPPVLQGGALGTVDISLYPLATQILRAAVSHLRSAGKRPHVLGLHWNQWETEVATGAVAIGCAKENYEALFAGFAKALGMSFPLWLYEPLSEVYENPTGLAQMHDCFLKLVAENTHMRLMPTSSFAGFDPAQKTKGVFLEDAVHYTPQVHRWFAQQQYDVMVENEAYALQ